MPLLARRAASAIERTLVYFRMNMYIGPPTMCLNSCWTHQIISGRCWTRASHPRWVASVVFCKRRLPVNFRYVPLTIELVLRCNMSRRAEGTNPLTRERAARGAEFVATTEDAVEIG